jgi:hypothetical protein
MQKADANPSTSLLLPSFWGGKEDGEARGFWNTKGTEVMLLDIKVPISKDML